MSNANEPTPGRHQRWFEAGAEAIAGLVVGLPEPMYACPLCRALLTIGEIGARMLTLEHVPPKSIGGREMVLTCEPCNSWAGHQLDDEMERFEAVRRFGSEDPLRPLPGAWSVGATEQRGTIHVGPGGILMVGVPKQTHPEHQARFEQSFPELLEVSGGNIELKLSERFDLRRALLSHVRAAYLAAFASLGYAYVFRPQFDQLRAAFGRDDDGTYMPRVLRRTDARPGDRHIGILTQPDWLAGALLVAIGQAGVVLPPVDPVDGDPMARLAEHWDDPDAMNGTFSTAPSWEWPTEPNHACDRWRIAIGAPPVWRFNREL